MDDQQRLRDLEARMHALSQQLLQFMGDDAAKKRAELYRQHMLGIENVREDFSEFIKFINERLKQIGLNTETFFDGFGVNPDFIKRFPNKIVNSGFEWYNTSTEKPLYWTGTGTITPDASWEGTVALQLTPGQNMQQDLLEGTTHAGADPAWWGDVQTRVSFKHKGGTVRCRVLLVADDSAYNLTDNSDPDNPRSGAYLDYTPALNWESGLRSFYFTPVPGVGKVKLAFENVDLADNVYIDAVQMEPDFTGKWPSLYVPGSRSNPMADVLEVPALKEYLDSSIIYCLEADLPPLV